MKIDGKEVRNFLFARESRLVHRGAIPVDHGKTHKVIVQVEAFDKDHAIKRLVERYPEIDKRDWDFIDELDPSHDVGRMGTKLPLNPLVVANPNTLQ